MLAAGQPRFQGLSSTQHKEREDEAPWERGWPLGFLNDSLWGHVTTFKKKTDSNSKVMLI